MPESPMIYSVHTTYNGGQPAEAEHYLSTDTRLDGLRARIVDLGAMTKADVASLGEEELCAVMDEILAPTKGSVSLTKAEMSDVPPEPATIKQLFVLDTQDYGSFTGLYRSTEDLLGGLVQKIFGEGETFFSASTKTEVEALLTHGRTGLTSIEDTLAILLSEIRNVLEDGPYAVYVHDVALPD